MKQMSDKELRKTFRIINQNYFFGAVQEPDEICFKKIKDDGRTRLVHPSYIYINSDFKRHPDMACIVLGHEMIHCALGDSYLEEHGFRFGAEVCRLWEMGFYEALL